MAEKTVKKVCKCENCGNEAEMVITCSLEQVPEPAAAQPATEEPANAHRTHGRGVCTHCGNEADMWVDLDA